MKYKKIPEKCKKCNSPVKIEPQNYIIDGIPYKVLTGNRTCNCDKKELIIFKLIIY